MLHGEILHAVPEMAQESWLETLKPRLPLTRKVSGTLCLRYISLDDPFVALTSFQLPCIWPPGPRRLLALHMAQQAPCFWQAITPAEPQDSGTGIFVDCWTIVSPVEHC